MAGAIGQEGPDPGTQVVVDPFASEIGAEDLGVNIVETAFNIKEERADFATRGLEGTYCIGESRTGIERI